MRIEHKQRLDRSLGWGLLLFLKPLAMGLGKVLGRDHRVEPAGEVVFLKMLGGGSLLIALPALLGLRRRYPELRLTLVCGTGVAPFAEILGVFDRIEVIEDQRGFAALCASGVRVLAALIRRRVDTVVDFEVYSVLTTVFSLLTCARNRIGFYLESTYWRRNVHTHLVFFNRSSGVHHFYEATVRLLGAQPARWTECRDHFRARLEAGAAEAFAPVGSEGLVAVGAGCSKLGLVRALPPAEWRALVRTRGEELCALPWVFLGAAEDRGISESVARAVSEELGPARFRHVNLCGELSLGASLSVLKRARRFVGIDSALLHAARCLGVPSISFWGPTHPATLLAPVDGLVEEVHYRPPICSPCLHVAVEPPCKGRNVCMELFTTDRVPTIYWCENSVGATVEPPATPPATSARPDPGT